MRARGIHLTHTRFQLVFRPLASQLHDSGESAGSHAQTFRAAGAETVVATLWPVSDEDAALLPQIRALQSIVQLRGTKPSLYHGSEFPSYLTLLFKSVCCCCFFFVSLTPLFC